LVPISEFSQDSDDDIFHCIDSDAKTRKPDLGGRCSNDSHASGNVGGDNSANDGCGGCNGGYNDKDNDNKYCTLWYKNNNFYDKKGC
jgi:hypothetical protein